jgi:hypothetical protein
LIETLSQIGELVGGFGALAALVYLALQIRQNNIIARAQARQSLIDTWSAGNWDLARDDELLIAFAAGLSKWPDIPNDLRTKFDVGMSRFLANIQNGLLLYEAGLLDEKVLDEISGYMVISVLSPGGSQWWAETSMAQPDVRQYIERKVVEAGADTQSIDEALPYWMAMFDDARSVES